MIVEQLVKIIREIAEIPSFSSYEEVLHPYILDKTKNIAGVKVHHIPDNNLIIEVPGMPGLKPVALSAHLDKINHFGENPPSQLPCREETSYVEGQMDDSVGLGICIALGLQSQVYRFPPLLLLFSEMEESYGLREHPQLLKKHGKGLYHGIGAERISDFLLKEDKLPSCVITVDTTPLFQGDYGVVLYSKHWHYTKTTPTAKEIRATDNLVQQMVDISPGFTLSNNTNDYLVYGKTLNQGFDHAIPSIAIEPAIYPYHQRNERVSIDDIENVYTILKTFLIETANSDGG